MIDTQRLQTLAQQYALPALTGQMLAQLDQYAQLLVEWNQKINLTAITDPEGILIKHFLDSLLLLHAGIPQNAALIDVGTGAGFPSLPVKIARPDLPLTLLDSLNKRVTFLQTACAQLGLKQTRCIHSRAEEGGRTPALREKFDIATARAVANLQELSEYCLPYVKVGGIFAALKGFEIEQELAQAQKAISTLGGQIEQIKKFELPGDQKRSIVIIRKISQTATKYPRPSAKIAKTPL